MSEDFTQYLSSINFDKHYEKLIKKLKNKKVIIYGSGLFFAFIKEHYDISSLNIIGISDKKFEDEQEGQDCFGYKIIPKDRIINYKPDYVIVATLNYSGIIEELICKTFNGEKIKVQPLARIPFFTMLQEIWST